jgi:hypothetical protein
MKRALLPPLCALLFASVALLSACGGARDGAGSELEALRTEIAKLRTETAMLADRVGALERPSSNGAAKASGSDAPAKGSASDRPPLEVVRLEPGSPRSAETSSAGGEEELALLRDAALDEEDDSEPRPVFRSAPGGAVVEDKAPKGALSASSKTPRATGPARSPKAEVPR